MNRLTRLKPVTRLWESRPLPGARKMYWGWVAFGLAFLSAASVVSFSRLAALASILAGIPAGLVANALWRPVKNVKQHSLPNLAESVESYRVEYRRQWEALPLDIAAPSNEAGKYVTLSSVYIALTAETDATRQDDIAHEAPWPDTPRPEVQARDIVLRAGRAVILGDAGSGKTTFLKHLGLAALTDGLHPSMNGCLPIFCKLSRYAARLKTDPGRDEVESFWQTVADDLPQHLTDLVPHLRDRATRGEILLLLDGLDEVEDGLITAASSAIQSLLSRYPHIPLFVITSRIRSYTPDLLPEAFVIMKLAPFTREKIVDFSRGWYDAHCLAGGLQKAEAAERANDLLAAALAPEIKPLAENPLLMTAIATIHQRDHLLPAERVRIYERCCRLLVEHWRSKRLHVSDSLAELFGDQNRLISVLQEIAYAMEIDREGVIKRSELLVLLEEPRLLGSVALAAEFLDFVDRRAGLLIGFGGGSLNRPMTYGFPHRTFQEYLAGCYVMEQRSEARLIRALAATDSSWRLPITLGCEDLHFNRRSTKRLLDIVYDIANDFNDERFNAFLPLLSSSVAFIVGEEQILNDDLAHSANRFMSNLRSGLRILVSSNSADAKDRVAAATSLGRLRDCREVGPVRDLEFLAVPEGVFPMGSGRRAGPLGYEGPKHDCHLDAYQISRVPISQSQFSEFIDAGGYENPSLWPEAEEAGFWLNGSFKGSRDLEPRREPWRFNHEGDLLNAPVVGVSWYECLAFTRWMTQTLRAEGELPARAYITLPSEAQYEKAAGEGTYPWGDNIDADCANFAKTGIGRVAPIGCFPRGRSAFGVEELSGNAWEWTRTLWQIQSGCQRFRYPYSTSDGRENIAAGPAVSRVLRGAACYNLEEHMQRSVRDCGFPAKWSEFVTFRVVLMSDSE